MDQVEKIAISFIKCSLKNPEKILDRYITSAIFQTAVSLPEFYHLYFEEIEPIEYF